ncbi:MAG: phosphatase PAP2 family protein [Syntrophothermus sp.]
MSDFFYSVDLAVFYFINHNLANGLFDNFFAFITEVKHWYIAFIILLGIVYKKGGRIGRTAAILSVIMIAFSDQLSSFFIKHWIARIRPCNALPDARLVIDCSGSFSFPSSHAVNNFAAFAYFSRLYPDYKWILFIVAFLVSLSRVYVGRHYPSDIIGGAIIGTAIGYLFSYAAEAIDKFIKERNWTHLINPRK